MNIFVTIIIKIKYCLHVHVDVHKLIINSARAVFLHNTENEEKYLFLVIWLYIFYTWYNFSF